MSEFNYINDRLDQQITWYSDRADSCQWKHKTLKIIEFSAAAIIPFLSGFGKEIPHSSLLIGCLGITIAISAGLTSLSKYHENWIQYRATSESLKHEKFLFLTQSGPYQGSSDLAALVERSEGLISKENSSWAHTLKQDTKAQAKV